MLENALFLARYDWLLWPSLVAFALSILLSLFALKLFPKWGLLDHPEKYGLKRRPIPYPGGIVIAIAFTLGSLWAFPLNFQLGGFLLGGVLLAGISFWDDRYGVPAAIRLGVQLLIGILVVWSGTRIVYISNPWGADAFELSAFWSVLVTILWIIALVNTVNWLDGVPGAAAGPAGLAGAFLGILSLTPIVDQPLLAVMCFVFAAANLGFLPFNIPPPKMLNGDTGAMFSGYVLAVLSIFAGGKVATVFLVLALPLFDAAAVIFHRLRERKSPLRGKDEKHLHDQLLKRGLSERQVMLVFLAISALLGAASLFLQTLGKISLLLLLGILVFATSWQHHRRKSSILNS